MSAEVGNVAALEGVIGKTPPAIHLKVIDHLDKTAILWLAKSPLMFTGFSDAATVAVTVAGGRAGFASADSGTLRLPLDTLDDPAAARPGCGFGSLFLAPGVGETLRVNGRVREVAGEHVLIDIRECYVHCAKALIRSAFWSAGPVSEVPADPEGFVSASRFMALATADSTGDTDLSPKGDPAGSMARMEGGELWFPDRPGNRRVDSFRNILTRPQLAALLLVPGSNRVLVVSGRARLTADSEALSRFEVQGKTPILATQISELQVELRESAALARAGLWPSAAADPELAPAKMLVAHMKINKDKGLAARLASTLVSIPGLMQKGLDKDYKTNLY